MTTHSVRAPLPVPAVLRWLAAVLLIPVLAGCVGASVAVPTNFPEPLLNKVPHTMGLVLSDELMSYVHEETIPEFGDWRIDIGPAQEPMFTRLLTGMFQAHARVSSTDAQEPAQKGVIAPVIKEVQFSIPNQTRSDYFEVWIRYEIGVYDQGTLIRTLPIAAYGKANVQNYGLSSTEPALQAAAWAACRDAMAYFAVQFQRDQAIQQWLRTSPAAAGSGPGQSTGGTRS